MISDYLYTLVFIIPIIILGRRKYVIENRTSYTRKTKHYKGILDYLFGDLQ